MINSKKIINIPIEKIKIGDEKFEVKYHDRIKNMEIEIKEFGVKRPFSVTKIGEDYVLYTCLNTFTAAKNAGLKEVPCNVISNKMMNIRIKELNFHRRENALKEI
jgi:hypothetical protein